MLYIAIKTLITSLVVVAVSEIARRSTTFAALLAALPLTSLLAFIWIYIDTGDTERIAELSYSILWLVIPTLVFFVVFPVLLKMNNAFWSSLLLACLITVCVYAVYFIVGKRLGLNL